MRATGHMSQSLWGIYRGFFLLYRETSEGKKGLFGAFLGQKGVFLGVITLLLGVKMPLFGLISALFGALFG